MAGCFFLLRCERCGESNADPALINFKPQAAVFVSFSHMAETRVGGGVGCQTLFEIGVVGIDFGCAIVLVEIQFGYLSFFLGYLFYLIFLSLVHFPGARAGKLGLKFNSEAVNDA